MMKWFIGVSSALIIGAMGWMTTFITMSYQARADIKELKVSLIDSKKEASTFKSEISAVRAITERTEKNTEEIRRYLLEKAIR